MIISQLDCFKQPETKQKIWLTLFQHSLCALHNHQFDWNGKTSTLVYKKQKRNKNNTEWEKQQFNLIEQISSGKWNSWDVTACAVCLVYLKCVWNHRMRIKSMKMDMPYIKKKTNNQQHALNFNFFFDQNNYFVCEWYAKHCFEKQIYCACNQFEE